MGSSGESSLTQTLASLAKEHRLRSLRTMRPLCRPEIVLDGQSRVDFCSNDYLGLSQHPALKAATQAAVDQYGTGTGGARLIGGTLDLHTQLEEAVAAFKGTEAALVFNSGYQANVGVLSGLVQRRDIILADKLNHASLVDGALLAQAKLIRYPHLDLTALEDKLAHCPKGVQKWIVTDTVFSMDGDQADLTALAALMERYDAWLILDEAHATGIYGEHHRSGLWETTGIGAHPRVIQIGTFSKALGSFGAYVAASREVVTALIQFSRSFVYSTSLPPGVVAANLAALELVQEEAALTQQLWANVDGFRGRLDALNLGLPAWRSPIIPWILGDASRTVQAAQTLLEAGFFVQAIRPPTVPEGTARLRITVSSLHQPDHLEALAQVLKTL